jgi:DNA-binding XRE family transcriptional regulator
MPPNVSNNYPGHIIPVLEFGPMVRLPLTPAEVERGKRLGALLRRVRGERSMLWTALTARVSPETLRKIESGRVATPAFSTVAAVAEVLGLSLDEVWAEINQSDHGDESTAVSPLASSVALTETV